MNYCFNIFLCGAQIYIAPSKALVQEKLRDWNQKFGPWGISCLELTGDNESYKLRNIQETDIILRAFSDIRLRFSRGRSA